jgi:hypothetical protein
MFFPISVFQNNYVCPLHPRQSSATWTEYLRGGLSEVARYYIHVVCVHRCDHKPYGGVVPELASASDLRNIVPVVRQALG